MNTLLNWLFPIRLDKLTVPIPTGVRTYTVMVLSVPTPDPAVTRMPPYIAKEGETLAAYSEAWIS